MTRATGIGSLPGTDIGESLRMTRDLFSDNGIPYLPELPARGPGGDMVGRTAALLADLHVDLQPSGWRFVDRPGKDARRTTALWHEDLDELAEAFDGYAGPLKLQVTGPWTLASVIALHRGERSVADEGAARDIVGSLAEGVRTHLAEVHRLVPGATLVLQVDEPGLPAALAGRLPTSSGFGRLRAVEPQRAADGIRAVLEAAEGTDTVVHCCDPDVPVMLLGTTGATALSLDTTLVGRSGWDDLATVLEAGTGLYAGCLPTDGSGTARGAVSRLVAAWREVGLPASALDDLVVTPACGLAGLTPTGAVSVQRMAVDAARELTDTAQE